jgi:hypothetical protein
MPNIPVDVRDQAIFLLDLCASNFPSGYRIYTCAEFVGASSHSAHFAYRASGLLRDGWSPGDEMIRNV